MMNEKLREKVAQHYVAQWSAGADDEGMLKKLYEEGLLFADRIIPFIRQDERERIFEWGNKPCDGDDTHWGTLWLPRAERRRCPECWEAHLKATVEKEG